MAPPSGGAKPAAKAPFKSAASGSRPPGAQGEVAARQALAQQAEERRKAATRKLFARIRSLEAIVGADLRKRGSLLLSQAVDQWYAEATSATASDVSITNAARAVISQLWPALPLQPQPAAGLDHLAGEPARVLADEEGDHVGDVFR